MKLICTSLKFTASDHARLKALADAKQIPLSVYIAQKLGAKPLKTGRPKKEKV